MASLREHEQQVEIEFDPASFRDRSARVLHHRGRILRALSPSALEDWRALRHSSFFPTVIDEGKLVATGEVEVEEFFDAPVAGISGLLEHAPIPFLSYPYEWSFEMLRDAALLHLDLLQAALSENMTLKDGSAYNVQWNGVHPVFIDVASFTRYEPGEPWAGYRQFCQLFLYPLMLAAYKRIAFQPLLRGSIHGIEPQQCRQLLSARDLLRRGVLVDVCLHARLDAVLARTQTSVKSGLRDAGFNRQMIEANVRRLRRTIAAFSAVRPSAWTDYEADNTYTAQDRQRKEQFVERVLAARRRRLVWDIGTNTGRFARRASMHSEYVVAMERDGAAVDELYKTLKTENVSNVLPLVIDLTDASPALGWRGKERKRLEERGQPDLVLCLALIHHLVFSGNLPLDEVIDWLAGLTQELVVEFVTKDDPMVKSLLRNRRDEDLDYTQENFERLLERAFQICSREMLACGTRVLYHARNCRSALA